MDIYSNIAAELITSTVTLLGIAVSASLIIWQVYKQNKSLLNQQEKKIKDEFKLTIYLEIEKILHVAASSLTNAISEVNGIPSALSRDIFEKTELGLSPEPIKQRVDTLLKRNEQAGVDLTNIIYAIERYEIALPKIETLRLAFFEKEIECADKFYSFFIEANEYLPRDIPSDRQSAIAGKTLIIKNATNVDIEKLENLAKAYAECAYDLQEYIYDFRIILQNSLLGHIFENRRLSGRKKVSQNLIILKTDDSEDMKELKSKLLRSGKWGKNLAEAWHGVSSDREDY